MKQMTKKIRPLMSTLLLLVAMLVPQGVWAQVASVTIGSTTKNYDEIQAATTAAVDASSAATIKLLQDVTLPGGTGLSFGKGDVTFDLNSHTISADYFQTINVVTGGKLTITDNSSAKSGKVACSGHSVNVSGGSLTIHAGTFESIGGSMGLYVSSNSPSTVSVDGGRFISKYAYAVYTSGASALAYGCAYFDTNTGAELPDYTDRPIMDVNGNAILDITVKKASVKATLTVGSKTTEYYTFKTFFEDAMNAGSAATVKLMQDGDYYKIYGYNGTFATFNKGDVTLDLNGHTLSTYYSEVLKVVDGGKLTITDTSADKAGKVLNKGGYAINAAGGSLTIHAGTFESTGGSWGLYVNSGSANVSVDGGRFIGGVCNTYGKSTLVYGYAYYNTSTGVELGEYTTRPICDENGNTAKDITVKKASVKATLTVGSTTTDCYTFEKAFEDAMNAGSAATVKLMQDGDYYKLYGFYADFVTFNKGDVTLDLNGHKLYTSSYAVLKVVEGGKLTVTDTSADKAGIVMNGGGYGVQASGGSVTIHNGTFQGGSWGLYVDSSSANVSVDGGRFIGGVYVSLSSSALADGYAYYNTATGEELKDYYDRPIMDEKENIVNDVTVFRKTPYAPICITLGAIDQKCAELNERDGEIRGDLKLTNLWNRVMDQVAAEHNRLNWDLENNPEPSNLRLGFHYTNIALINASIAIYEEAVKQHLSKDEKIQSIFDALLKLVSSRNTMAAQYSAVLDDDAEWKSLSARLDIEEAAVNALEGTDPTIEELEAHEAELSAISAAMEAFAAKMAAGPTAISSAAKAEGTVNGAYNLRGQKVSSNFKGIVIKNGKKVMVK